MQVIRVWIEGFLRGRYGYEGNQALRVLAVPVLIGALLTPVLLVTGPLLWIAAIALVLLLLGMIERRVKPKPKDRGLRAAEIVPLVVVVLIVAACWGASLGVWMMWVLHTE